MVITTPNARTAASLLNLGINNQCAVGPWAAYYAQIAIKEATTLSAVLSSVESAYSETVVLDGASTQVYPTVCVPTIEPDGSVLMHAVSSQEIFEFLDSRNGRLAEYTTPEQLMEDAGEYVAKLFGSASYFECIATHGQDFSVTSLKEMIESHGLTPNATTMPELQAMLKGVASSQVLEYINLAASRVTAALFDRGCVAEFDARSYYGGNVLLALGINTFSAVADVIANFEWSFQWVKDIFSAIFNGLKGTLDLILQALGIGGSLVASFSFEKNQKVQSGILDAPVFDHTFTNAEFQRIYSRIHELRGAGDRVDLLAFFNAVAIAPAPSSQVQNDSNHGRDAIMVSPLASTDDVSYMSFLTELAQQLYDVGARSGDSAVQRVIPVGNQVCVVTAYCGLDGTPVIRTTIYATSWTESLYGLQPVRVLIEGDPLAWNDWSQGDSATFAITAIEAGQPMQWSRDEHVSLPDNPNPSDFWKAFQDIYSYTHTSHGMTSSIFEIPGFPYYGQSPFGVIGGRVVAEMDRAANALGPTETVNGELLVQCLHTVWDGWASELNGSSAAEADYAIKGAYELLSEVFGRLIASDELFEAAFRRSTLNHLTNTNQCWIIRELRTDSSAPFKFARSFINGVKVNTESSYEIANEIRDWVITPILTEVDLKGEYHVLTWEERYEKTKSTVVGVIAAIAAIGAAILVSKAVPTLKYKIATARAKSAQALANFRANPTQENYNMLSRRNKKKALLGQFTGASGFKASYDDRPTEIIDLLR